MSTLHSDLTGVELHFPFNYMGSSDPGAVGAGKTWLDTTATPYALKVRNGGDSAWINIGVAATFTARVDDSDVDTAATILNFSGQSFDVTSSPAGEANVFHKPISAAVFQSGSQSAADDTMLELEADFDDYDLANFHDPMTDSDRLVVPFDGYYAFSLWCSFDVDATGSRWIAIESNNAGVAGGGSRLASERVAAAPSGTTEITIFGIAFIAAGDYITAFALQDSGGALDVTMNRFSIAKV